MLLCGGSLLIAANPRVPFNPFPPPTLPSLLVIPSPLPTAAATDTPSPTIPPSVTWTPTITASPTTTASPTPSLTPSHTFTPTHTPTLTPSQTPVLPNLPTNTPIDAPISTVGVPAQSGIILPTGPAPPAGFGVESPFAFVAAQPIRQANTNAQGCNWLSIAGQVRGLLGQPILNLAVEVTGQQFAEVRFSGAASRYGASGWEINVGNRPQQADFAVRILGQDGNPLSDYVLVQTGDTCDTNVTILTFQQVQEY